MRVSTWRNATKVLVGLCLTLPFAVRMMAQSPVTGVFDALRVGALKSPSGSYYLCIDSTGNFTSSATTCSGSSVTPHNLLSATHSDTAATSPVRGGVIVANSTPAWAQVALCTSGYYLGSNGTDTGCYNTGAAFTNLNASNISSGTLNTARLPATITIATGLTVTGLAAGSALYYPCLNVSGTFSSQATPCATIAVANGGTNLTSGTSGGVLGYTATGVLASSAALTAHGVMLGGGAGATPTALSSLGTASYVLTSNGAGADPSWQPGGGGGGPAAAGTLTGTTLAANVVNSSLTSVGTLTNMTTSGTVGATYIRANDWAPATGVTINLNASTLTTFNTSTSNGDVAIGTGASLSGTQVFAGTGNLYVASLVGIQTRAYMDSSFGGCTSTNHACAPLAVDTAHENNSIVGYSTNTTSDGSQHQVFMALLGGDGARASGVNVGYYADVSNSAGGVEAFKAKIRGTAGNDYGLHLDIDDVTEYPMYVSNHDHSDEELFWLTPGGQLRLPQMDANTAGSGIYVCIDSVGKLYKKSTCP